MLVIVLSVLRESPHLSLGSVVWWYGFDGVVVILGCVEEHEEECGVGEEFLFHGSVVSAPPGVARVHPLEVSP